MPPCGDELGQACGTNASPTLQTGSPLANTVPDPAAAIVGGAPQGSPVVASVMRETGSPFTNTFPEPAALVSPQLYGSDILVTAGIIVFILLFS